MLDKSVIPAKKKKSYSEKKYKFEGGLDYIAKSY